MTDLYEYVDNHTAKCRICGKEIYPFGPNGGNAKKSHARMHVRKGEAKEVHKQSPRCYAGYDIDFIIVKENVGV